MTCPRVSHTTWEYKGQMAQDYHRILHRDDRAYLSPRLVYLGASLSCTRSQWGHTPFCEIPYGRTGTFEQSDELGKRHSECSLIRESLHHFRRAHDSLAQRSVMIVYNTHRSSCVAWTSGRDYDSTVVVDIITRPYTLFDSCGRIW